MTRGRQRLDEVMVLRGLAVNRNVARGLIMAGSVLVDGAVSDKAGTPVRVDSEITVKVRSRFVSRAGAKLARALVKFEVDAKDRLALDVGASTGGFVQCLLEAGAQRVIALDVGHGQLDVGLRNDVRVVVMEGVNARYLSSEKLPYRPDLLTMDVSFISVRKILDSVVGCMAEVFEGLVLVKPQFEAERGQVGKKGVVRDPDVHRSILLDMCRFLVRERGVDVLGLCQSAVPGARGNQEFFFHFARGREKGLGLDRLEALVEEVVGG